MTKKNANKLAARARKGRQGGKYLAHLRHVGGGDGTPSDHKWVQIRRLSFGGTEHACTVCKASFEVKSGETVDEVAAMAFDNWRESDEANSPTTLTRSMEVSAIPPRCPGTALSPLAILFTSLAVDTAFGVQISGAASERWQADSGTISRLITQHEHQLLADSGAADGAKIHIIRSYRDPDDRKAMFSARCDSCAAWVFCGNEAHVGLCGCTRPYRVVFDLAPTLWGTLEDGVVCMDCALDCQRGAADVHQVNQWQVRCRNCFANGRTAAERNRSLMVMQSARTTQRVHVEGAIDNARNVGAVALQQSIAEVEDATAAVEREYERLIQEVGDGRDDSDDRLLGIALGRQTTALRSLNRRVLALMKTASA